MILEKFVPTYLFKTLGVPREPMCLDLDKMATLKILKCFQTIHFKLSFAFSTLQILIHDGDIHALKLMNTNKILGWGKRNVVFVIEI